MPQIVLLEIVHLLRLFLVELLLLQLVHAEQELLVVGQHLGALFAQLPNLLLVREPFLSGGVPCFLENGKEASVSMGNIVL